MISFFCEGRSNVGKSRIINALAQSTSVRVKNEPGITRSLNLFRMNRIVTLIDVPGYGFAFGGKGEEDGGWMDMVK